MSNASYIEAATKQLFLMAENSKQAAIQTLAEMNEAQMLATLLQADIVSKQLQQQFVVSPVQSVMDCLVIVLSNGQEVQFSPACTLAKTIFSFSSPTTIQSFDKGKFLTCLAACNFFQLAKPVYTLLHPYMDTQESVLAHSEMQEDMIQKAGITAKALFDYIDSCYTIVKLNHS